MAKKKSASVQRGQVKLREKKLKDGSSSLYLDINVGGKRHKEYLKLYQVDFFMGWIFIILSWLLHQIFVKGMESMSAYIIVLLIFTAVFSVVRVGCSDVAYRELQKRYIG